MTQKLFVGSFVLFILTALLFVTGIASAAIGSVALGFMCIAPLAFMMLGGALARFASEFEVTRKGVTKSANGQTKIRGGQQPSSQVLQ